MPRPLPDRLLLLAGMHDVNPVLFGDLAAPENRDALIQWLVDEHVLVDAGVWDTEPGYDGPRAIHDTYGEDLTGYGGEDGGFPPFDVGEPLYRVARRG